MKTILISVLIFFAHFSAFTQTFDNSESALGYLQLFEDLENLFGHNKVDFIITEEKHDQSNNKWKLKSYSESITWIAM